jgi:hypothetical protein
MYFVCKVDAGFDLLATVPLSGGGKAALCVERKGEMRPSVFRIGHFGQLATPIPEPSLGLVNTVVRYLRDEAFIEGTEEGRFRLRDPVKLLFAWRDAYRFERHERRGYFTLLQGKKLRDANYSGSSFSNLAFTY